MHTRTWIVIVTAAAASCGSRADFIVNDSLREDQGWTTWDSKVSFSKKGMTAFGVVTRDFKEFPAQFDAAVTIEASKSYIWGFGVAGSYSPETGYSGIGFAANADKEIGVMFARWDRDSIVDMMRVDIDSEKVFNGRNAIEIGVREDVAFAAIDGTIVAKIAYKPEFGGNQVVIASYSEDETFFSDLVIGSRVPGPGVLMAFAPMAAFGARRRRE